MISRWRTHDHTGPLRCSRFCRSSSTCAALVLNKCYLQIFLREKDGNRVFLRVGIGLVGVVS